jgi:hypothetical protein
MNDKELADKVVALGVAAKAPCEKEWWLYYTPEIVPGLTAKNFVRDWRVAGALMERCQQNAHELAINTAWERFSMFMMVQIRYEPYLAPELANPSMFMMVQIRYEPYLAPELANPRAVIEACVEALEDSGDGKRGIDWSKVPETIQPSELKLWQENIDDD